MMKPLLATACALALGACATTGPETALKSRIDPQASTYGLFLAGRAALADGRSEEAAAYFARASQGSDAQVIDERAFTAALLSGDVAEAARLAPISDEAAESAKRLGALTRAVDHLAAGRGEAAYGLLESGEISFPHRGAAALLSPWAAAMAGEDEAAIVRPQLRGDAVVEVFGQVVQAHQFERLRRYDEAETNFKTLTAASAGELPVLAHGGFLERRGRRAEALALYEAALAEDPRNVAIAAARDRVAKRRPPPRPPTAREGAAESLMANAATMLAAKQMQFAMAYLRLALHLDPDRAEAWLTLGDLMAAQGEYARAREAYANARPGTPEFIRAQAKTAWSHQEEGDPETAIALAREAAAGGDPLALLTLSDLLSRNDRWAEAVEVLNRLIGEGEVLDADLLFARGAAYERQGDVARAEADLQAALALAPDDPDILNYLGYLWIDRGERLDEALKMVEKAAAARPRSGAIVDSLGWAHYRLGDFEKAVELLERAVALEAGDPEINNHLGDAYWRVGRRDEAEFQWRRVLTLDPDAEIQADAQAKLAAGLGPDGPAAPAVLAGP